MEPEMILTRKIRAVERKPVHWKKAEVWFAIHEQISTAKKSYRFYYYAAAVVFFMFFNIYQLTVGNELTLDTSKPLTITTVNEHQQEVPEVSVVDYIEMADTQPERTRHERQVPAVENSTSEALVFEHETIETAIQPIHEATIVSKVDAVGASQKVAPIIGVILNPVNTAVSVKPKRERLFHKLESAESEFDGTHQDAIIIARIK
jgi:hypothetical protein